MAVVHQSDLSAYVRCPQAMGLQRAGLPRRQLSATAYGSVMHHAVEVYERLIRQEGTSREVAIQAAIDSFRHYWHPYNIEQICEPVEDWMPKHSYSALLSRGITNLEAYFDIIKDVDDELLATEYSFSVPIENTWDEELGQPHILKGTSDRVSVQFIRRVLALCMDDYKAGAKIPRYLRHNLQFTAYCYASTRPEFWMGWDGDDGFGPERGRELFERFKETPRHGRWINLHTIEIQDAGWRGPQDYQRFALAVEQVMAAVKADIFPLNISGEVCTYCEYKDVCGGIGLPADDHGAPGR